MLFKLIPGGFSDLCTTIEQLKFRLEKIIGIKKPPRKVSKVIKNIFSNVNSNFSIILITRNALIYATDLNLENSPIGIIFTFCFKNCIDLSILNKLF